MLQMKAKCERCGKDLAPDSAGASICSFECTFCAECTTTTLAHKCPNCGGELLARPRRAAPQASERT